MKQYGQAAFKSDDGKIQLICDSDTALGKLHDFLMAVKGEIVDRMVKAQKDEEEIVALKAEEDDVIVEKPPEEQV